MHNVAKTRVRLVNKKQSPDSTFFLSVPTTIADSPS
jgi:hypothetical protein